MPGIDSRIVVILLSALAAAGTFVAIAVPLIKRAEKKERVKEVVEKKRRALFEQAREQAHARPGKQAEKTAAQNIAAIYKLQSFLGSMGAGARMLLVQAGVRDTKAVVYYVAAHVMVPLLLMGWCASFFHFIKKPIAPSIKMLILMTAFAFGASLPRILLKNLADKRKAEISLAFPDALDMLLICVQGGIGIEAAINRIGGVMVEHSEVLAEELGILSAELGMLNDRKAAFQGFAARVGSGPARSFATAMLQAEQYGTSVSKALRVLAEESREERMAKAEQKAASLPPKLTVPMILFFLPPLFVIILGPAFLSIPHLK